MEENTGKLRIEVVRLQNCIVKIINGRPVVFGEAGKDEKDALVYIFEEEEAFNAALDAGMIPVGTLIVKTYDEVEMAGGPFDDALSDVSENAVQNKVITNALSKKSSLGEYGMSKICPVDTTDVTETDSGLVLGAIEKNASVEGTIASEVEKLKTELTWKLMCENSSKSQIPNFDDYIQRGAKEFYVRISDGYFIYTKMFPSTENVFYEWQGDGESQVCVWYYKRFLTQGEQIGIEKMKKDGSDFEPNDAKIDVYYRQ